MERRRRLRDVHAIAAKEFLTDRLDNLPRTRNHLERFGHVLAQLRQSLAAARWACAWCRDYDALTRQTLGQRQQRKPMAQWPPPKSAAAPRRSIAARTPTLPITPGKRPESAQSLPATAWLYPGATVQPLGLVFTVERTGSPLAFAAPVLEQIHGQPLVAAGGAVHTASCSSAGNCLGKFCSVGIPSTNTPIPIPLDGGSAAAAGYQNARNAMHEVSSLPRRDCNRLGPWGRAIRLLKPGPASLEGLLLPSKAHNFQCWQTWFAADRAGAELFDPTPAGNLGDSGCVDRGFWPKNWQESWDF
eukprot:gene20540-21197_t